ncbi:MAG: class I SAM-dependent methyltransferase [Actinomycetota bacterium]
MSERSGCRWGSHHEFAELYEPFLNGIYARVGDGSARLGRKRLTEGVGDQIRQRHATTVLDCAAGTGFPAIDLALEGLDIHCSDGDPHMIAILAKRALDHGLHLDRLTPPRRPDVPRPTGADAFVLPWKRLDWIPRRYDYVLCRGNSLAYADTWSGRDRAANEQVLTTYLERMITRVKPGGHLHVDAPWKAELPTDSYSPGENEAGTVWEHVEVDRGQRQWTVSFKAVDAATEDRPVAFRRYSSLLTIDRYAKILSALGMEEAEPFQMPGERPTFGTIVAKRPHGRATDAPTVSTRRQRTKIRVALQVNLSGRSRSPERRAGSHADLVDVYGRYLDALYNSEAGGSQSGRWALMRSLAAEFRNRRATDILDCAAGTGFPLVDLAADSGGEFRIHCADGDVAMVKRLAERAGALGVAREQLAPPRTHHTGPFRPEALRLDWSELDRVAMTYDYVLCRGNSLAFADTWRGQDLAASESGIAGYLALIAKTVKPGGHLHVDAPWVVGERPSTRELEPGSMSEHWSVHGHRREWRLRYLDRDAKPTELRRSSSLLTARRLQGMLDRLGFVGTEPFALPGELDDLGVIIARKPLAT